MEAGPLALGRVPEGQAQRGRGTLQRVSGWGGQSPSLLSPHWPGRDLSPSSIVEARWWSGHIRRTARRPLRWARRVWGPSRDCWVALGTQSGLQQAHHVSKFLAKLRHFSVETGNLLKTHQIVSQVPQQSSPLIRALPSPVYKVLSYPLPVNLHIAS